MSFYAKASEDESAMCFDGPGPGEGKGGDEVGGEPVGLAESAKNSGLDVLDPAVDIEVAGDGEAADRDAEVFGEGVEAGEEAAHEDSCEGFFGGTAVEVADISVVEQEVADGGKEAAVEAGVVTKEAGVGVSA